MHGAEDDARPLLRHVAVVGAAGGLGRGILKVCRAEAIGFTAVVRSRPERIREVPDGSRVAVVSSLADRPGALGNHEYRIGCLIMYVGQDPGSGRHDQKVHYSYYNTNESVDST